MLNRGILFLVTLGLLDVLGQPALGNARERFKALCSAYSPFEPCEVFLYTSGRITANIPGGYLDVNRASIKGIDICDADVVCKPLLAENLESVWKGSRVSPFAAVVDFRLRYLNDFSKSKTVLLRFYNRKAAETFGSRLLVISGELSPS